MREIKKDCPSIRVDDYYVQVETAGSDEKGLYLETFIYKYKQVGPSDVELVRLEEKEIPQADLDKINEALHKVVFSHLEE